MEDINKILLGIIVGLILVASAIVFAPSQSGIDDNDFEFIEHLKQSVEDLNSSENATITINSKENLNTNNANVKSSSNSNSKKASKSVNSNTNNNNNNNAAGDSSSDGIVGEKTEYNAQQGGGTYYQVDYGDGNFRQYDTKTGQLLGSSFDSDQERLGVVDGQI